LYVLLYKVVSFNLFDCRVPEDQGNEELMSIYETLYPLSDPPPPPLPPRTFPPCSSVGVRHSKHRPLERTRALPYQEGCVAMNPPEVHRQHKPVPVLSSTLLKKTDCSSGKVRNRHLQNQQGPSLPPKPKKLLNPEDSFAFEIIDTDEIKPVQTVNMPVTSCSSQNLQKSRVVSCTKLKETGRCEAHGLNVDAILKSNNNEDHSQIVSVSSAESKSGFKKPEEGAADVSCNSDELKGTNEAISLSNNNCNRPKKLAVKVAPCNVNGIMKEGECVPIVSAPLATPEQDGSLVDSSSLENLLNEDEDAVFLTPDNEIAAGETYACHLPDSSSSMQQDIVLSNSSVAANESSIHHSCTHSWPVNDVHALCNFNHSNESKASVSSSHETDQDGSVEVSTDGMLTDAHSNANKHQLCLLAVDSSKISRPKNFTSSATQLDSASAVSFQDLVCEMPVILTDMSNRENSADCAVSGTSGSSNSDVNNIYTSSLLSVPNPFSSSISPVSPNSLSDSGMALSSTTDCSTSSGSDTNTMVLSNHSSSPDSLGAGVVMSANADVTNSESGDKELVSCNKNVGLQSEGVETVPACFDIVDVDEENATEDSNKFVDASMEELGSLNSPLRAHKPLSRQVSHPPLTSLVQRPDPSAAPFCSAARLPLQRQAVIESSATVPRPHNRYVCS